MFEFPQRFKTMPGISVLATNCAPLELRKVMPPETEREDFFMALIELLANQLITSPATADEAELDDEGDPISYVDMVKDRDEQSRRANMAVTAKSELMQKIQRLNLAQGATASVEARLQMLIDGLNHIQNGIRT